MFFKWLINCIYNTSIQLPMQSTLVLEEFYYSVKRNNYLLILRFKNKTETLKLSTKELFTHKDLIELLSPIDAYFVGIILGLESNQIALKECDAISTYFKRFRVSSSIKPILKVADIELTADNKFITIQTQFTKKTTKIPILELSKKPYLLQAMSNKDALYIGANSLDVYMNHD